MHLPRLVEDETYVFSRAWLKRGLRMHFKRTTCNTLSTFCFSLQFLYWTKSLHVCFHSNFSPKFWKGQTVPLAVLIRTNFNYSAGLVQWRGLAQTLLSPWKDFPDWIFQPLGKASLVSYMYSVFKTELHLISKKLSCSGYGQNFIVQAVIIELIWLLKL